MVLPWVRSVACDRHLRLHCRDAMDCPERAVRLSMHQRAMLRAQSLPPLSAAEVHRRPRPHFRTHPPGIRTVIIANLLLVYLVCTIKV